ncbi:MAG TPA: type II toxin-antitoxin system HicB family antitoxin [Microbacterium sp.]|uniref:type II toxin-antitoxin system HicB family antitoxin n=1 Tax=Microbacterium sp. TaxID=51671 RepID=UPI002F931873
MRKLFVSYHHEDESWWAESDDLDGFTAVGSTLEETRTLVRDGVDFYLEGETVQLVERTDEGMALNVASAVEVHAVGWWTAFATQASGVASGHGGVGVSVSSGPVPVAA